MGDNIDFFCLSLFQRNKQLFILDFIFKKNYELTQEEEAMGAEEEENKRKN